MESVKAWGNYWKRGGLTTFGDKPTYQGELRNFWLEFLRSLDDGAVIADLGAGNGALEEIAQSYCKAEGRQLTVHAIDAAKLAPRIGTVSGIACEIVWHPGTRSENTGLPAGSVDAVIANFGFEYGDDEASIKELRRILKAGARARFLMHHAESTLISDSASELAVLEEAMRKGGMFDLAREYLREHGSIHKPNQFKKLQESTEAAEFMRQMDDAHAKVAALATRPYAKALVATISKGIFSLMTPPRLYEPKQNLLGYLSDARSEYHANLDRLADMKRAQVSTDRLGKIKGLFEEQGMSVTAEPFMVEGFDDPVGWAVDIEA